MKYTLIAMLLMFSALAHAQVSDSIDISYVSNYYDEFEIVGSNSPLLLFSNGALMAKEQLWYFKMDPAQKLLSFARSIPDSSYYIISDNGIVKTLLCVYTGRLKKDKSTVLDTFKSNILYSKVYPVSGNQYYLLEKSVNGIYNVYFCTQKNKTVVLTTKEKINRIIPFDGQSFACCYNDRLDVNDKNSAKTLFRSAQTIFSVALQPNGTPYVADAAGVFKVMPDFSLRKLSINVQDANIRIYGNEMFVLSRKKNRIYKYKLS